MTVTPTAVPPRIVARTIADVVDAVRSASADAEPLRVAGRGSWLDAGAPVQSSQTLDLSCLRGITEYVPGDLTLTAHAGTSLSEIEEATAAHGQWLPLDPFGDSQGTLGATLATASAGPVGGSIGLPRDVTVGLSFVTGTGEVVRGGGRVVKNVAGFDLVRLSIGAWGTLGVITSATVRLRAHPEADETVALMLPHEQDALVTLLSTVRSAAIEPLSAELVSATCARRIGLADKSVMLVRLAGNAIGVHHQRAELAKLGPCDDVEHEVWQRLRLSDPGSATVVRVSRRPSELARLWLTALKVTDVDAHATLSRGVVRLRLNAGTSITGFDTGDHLIVERGPVTGSGIVLAPEPNEALARRLRDAFDPHRILNRGIMGPEST